MIHILQSVSNMDRGGIESMLMNYYRHLDRTRFQFDFLVNKKKPGFFDNEIRALGGRIFQSPGVAPQSYPAYLRSMQQLLAQHPEIKVLHAHNEAMQLFALEGAKKAGLPVRIAHAHNTRLPKDAKLPIKWFCKQFIPGAATDYWACGREAGIYYFGQSAWDARGVTLRNAIDLDRFGYRPQVRAKLRAEYGEETEYRVSRDVKHAVKELLDLHGERDLSLIVGSLYLAGEVKEQISKSTS